MREHACEIFYLYYTYLARHAARPDEIVLREYCMYFMLVRSETEAFFEGACVRREARRV